jgi:hypothetical protein
LITIKLTLCGSEFTVDYVRNKERERDYIVVVVVVNLSTTIL